MLDDVVLDDADALVDRDRHQVLWTTAEAGAQVRLGRAGLDDTMLDRVLADGRPRAVVVAGVGVAALAADIAVAVFGPLLPAPVVAVAGHQLPGWVGPVDLVVVTSVTGDATEPVLLAAEAARRGARTVVVAPPRTPLAEQVRSARGGVLLQIPEPSEASRAHLWSLLVPLVSTLECVAAQIVSTQIWELAADVLDARAASYGPAVSTADNLAKELALELAPAVPVVWGSGSVGGVAAGRAVAQFAGYARLPAVGGRLPHAARTQLPLLDGPLAAADDAEDLFRDRVADPDGQRQIRLLLLRDTDETEVVSQWADAVATLAEQRRLGGRTVRAEGDHPVMRLASILPLVDFAAAYAALAVGVDPGARAFPALGYGG
ncbi:MAG: mannose-6-phosphate isomerase [Actinomycetota bacterium]|nr:MAG: mannose-6-phosphate isomerase [Actinomycetota bacterium]